MSRLPPRLRVYVAAVAGAGLVAVGLAAGAVRAPSAAELLLAGLVVACGSWTVPVPGTSVRLTADTPFLLALVDVRAGALAILATAIGQALATIVSGAWRRGHTVPFNAGAGALAALSAVVVHRATERALAPVPVLLAGWTAFAISTLVVLGAVRLASGRFPRMDRDLLLTCAAYLASASLGHILVTSGPLAGTVLLVTPLVLLLAQAYASHRDRVQERIDRVAERDRLFLPTLEALIAAIEARDPQAHGHNHRVRAYAMGAAHALGFRDEATLTALRYGAILHDVGRIAIPDRLLHAGALAPEDLELVRRHVLVGGDLVCNVPFPPGVREIVRHHHERWDGQGYPDRLAGEAIPLPARIVAVCDAFDDLCNGGWRPAVAQDRALAALEADAGRAFDPAIVAAFCRWQRAVGPEPHGETPMSSAGDEIRLMSREQARLSNLALADELTGLANGRALQRELEARCVAGAPFALLLLDLDGFKGLNDHHGHAVGDRALVAVGDALRGLGVLAYRNGGDEFVVIGGGAAADEIERVRTAIEARSVRVRGGTVALRASVGGVTWRGGTPSAALQAADEAMYAVKASRRSSRGEAPTVVAAG